MKQHLSNVLRAFVCGLAFAALGALLLALILVLYDMPRTVALAAAPWALLLLITALVCELIAAREGNLLIYLLACAALLYVGSGQVVSRTAFVPFSAGFPVFLRLLVLCSGAACARAALKLPPSDLFVRLGDALVAALTCFLALCFFLGDPLIPSVLAFSLAALCASLLSAAVLRAGGESERVVRGAGTGGLLILLSLFAVCVLLAAGLLSLASGRIDSVVGFLLSVWHAVIAVISRAFEIFVRFIALFMPKPVQYNMTAGSDSAFLPEGAGLEITAATPEWLIYLFIGVIALLILAAVLAILWMLRGMKLTRAPRRKAARRVTRQSRMLESLLARIRAIREAIAFELAYRSHRRSAQGLYVLAVRTCRLTKRHKRASESPAAFIRRLHADLLAKSGLSTLDALADKLERALYAGEAVPLSHGESDAFAAQIQAAAKLPAQRE